MATVPLSTDRPGLPSLPPLVSGVPTMPPRFLSTLATTRFRAAPALLPAGAQDKGDSAKTDGDQLQGTWNIVQRRKKGEELQTITFQGDKLEIKKGGAA